MRKMAKVFWKVIYLRNVFLFYFFRFFPIEEKVIFDNFNGKGFGDNAKYTYNKLIDTYPNIKCVWLVKNMNENFPKYMRLVKYGSVRSIYEMATSSVWVDNSRKPAYVRKRKNQFYIQLWHGGDPGKRVEMDTITPLPKAWIVTSKRDALMTDVMVADSQFCKNLFSKSFWYNGPIMEWGSPREDVLFDNSILERKSIKSSIGIKENSKIVLYAPTFRSNKNTNVFDIDISGVKQALSKRFGGEWTFLVRFHPLYSHLTKGYKFDETTIDCTNYPDMQELLVIADVEISDYSGTPFEFAGIQKRPVFIFAIDLEDYLDDRGFYYNIKDWPFSLSRSNDELINSIMSFSEEKYQQSIKTFNEGLHWYVDGDSSRKVAQLIYQNI